jgi:VWFA-related protein
MQGSDGRPERALRFHDLIAIVGIAWCVATSGAVSAQEATQAPVFRTGVEVVQVAVTVLDGEGRPVAGLSRDDFVIQENGTPRPIVAFRSLQSEAEAQVGSHVEPIVEARDFSLAPAVVVLLDDLNTSPYNTHRAIRGARGILDALPVDALVSVVETSAGRVPVRFSYPSEAHRRRVDAFRGQLLLAPVAKGTIRTPSSSVSAPCGVGSHAMNSQDCADPTRATRRAEVLGAVGLALQQMGVRRKVVLWLTEDMGVSPLDEQGTRRAQREALKELLNADAAVFPVNPAEGVAPTLGFDDGRPDRRAGNQLTVGRGEGMRLDADDWAAVPLSQLARETGGRWITDANDIDTLLGRVVRESLTAYLLAFEPSDAARPGRRSIAVTTRRRDLQVYARQGYFVDGREGERAQAASIIPGFPGHLATLVASAVPTMTGVAVRFLASVDTGAECPCQAHVTIETAAAPDGEAVDLGLIVLDDQARIEQAKVVRRETSGAAELLETTVPLVLTSGVKQLRVAAAPRSGRNGTVLVTDLEVTGRVDGVGMAAPQRLRSGSDTPTGLTLSRRVKPGEPFVVTTRIAGKLVQDNGVTVGATLLDDASGVLRPVTVENIAVVDSDDARALRIAMDTSDLEPGRYWIAITADGHDKSDRVTRRVEVVVEGRETASPALDTTRLAPVPVYRVAHGTLDRALDEGQVTIASTPAWAEFWHRLGTSQPPPAIDFDRFTVLAVLGGVVDGVPHQPSIEKVVSDASNLRVEWTLSPGDLNSTQHAFVAVAVPKVSGSVSFVTAVQDP